jgi:hypothetical protein
MLRFIQEQASERKLRLYAAAGCRMIWHLLTDERSRGAVEVAERFADGLASEDERLTALALAREAVGPLPTDVSSRDENGERAILSLGAPTVAALAAQETVSNEVTHDEIWVLLAAFKAAAAADKGVTIVTTRTAQAAVLRDNFANPFRPTVVVAPSVLAWSEQVVVRLAQSVYEDHHLPDGTLDNARLAVLADALEEAGVTDTFLLEHLRGPGPHVRGCFVLDAILGRT